MTSEPALAVQMKGITKQFPGVLANDHIDLDVRAGEILALLGENGAGKSTLMSILSGLYQADEGDTFVRGYSHLRCKISRRRQPVNSSSRIAAAAKGAILVKRFLALGRCLAPGFRSSTSQGMPSVSASRSADPSLIKLLAVTKRSWRCSNCSFRRAGFTPSATRSLRVRKQRVHAPDDCQDPVGLERCRP